MRVSTPPPASSAGSDDANRTRLRVLGDVERFDAEPVASEQNPSAVALDDREREHSEQPVDEAVAPVVVGLEQHLGVAVGEEPVAVLGQLAAQVLVVVDAAVPRDGETEVGVDHRLCARLGQIDDLQPAMSERDPALRPRTRRIGTARCHCLGHGRHRRKIRRSAVESHLAGGSTHRFDPTGRRPVGRTGGLLPVRRAYETPSNSPVSSTCLIGPVNQFFTDTCQ